jgi:esterase/lipase superfamily enzyme
MNTEYYKWYSPAIGRDMELKVYGQWGQPILVFPAQGGRFYEFEDFGMVEACRELIESGKVKIFAVDSLDNETWANFGGDPAWRAQRHEDYDRYITQEVLPFIRGHCRNADQKVITTGVSMGGFHAGNFFFRHPDAFCGCICLSAIFQLKLFVGDYVDDCVYFNSPLFYLPNLNDPWFIEQYRQSRIIVCVGQGAFEDEMLSDARTLQGILADKGIPAQFDYWGHDVNHDWPWWRQQLPYFLGQL